MRVITVILIMVFGVSMINATTFTCKDYKRNLYAKIWQSSNGSKMSLYNAKGRKVDSLRRGRAKAGNTRWYGSSTTIYVYKNKRQFSIRTYNRRSNKIGNIFGVFKCRQR
ncbi:MAG: hypothetical protein QM493_08810 [Sulfurovum sp.]